MNSIRWGLCCLFREVPIKFRTTTATYVAKLKLNQREPLTFLSQLILDNINALAAALVYCHQHAIGSFRINSQLFPLYTHPALGYDITDLPDATAIYTACADCKTYAEQHRLRLTFHPDQFVVINSPHAHVVANSIAELEYHAEMADLLGADVINIHAGGVYGDKKMALISFENNFASLSHAVRKRLTIENDDKSFTPEDLLPMCQRLNIPLVYDVHHHRCLPDSLSIAEASHLAYASWNREPLFHISSPLEGWKGAQPQRHHDYIDIQDFPGCWLKLLPLTVEVEAKAKECAVKKLSSEVVNLHDAPRVTKR